LVTEYNERKILAELGYTTSIDELDDYTANAFLEIASLYSDKLDKEMKRKS